MPASEVVFTGKSSTVKSKVHGKASKPSSRRCCTCNTPFTPRRSTAKYCSSDCRGAAFRTRHKPRQRAVPIPVLVASRCAHCGMTFAACAGKGQVYCDGSCKSLAYRARRAALIEAIADYRGLSVDVAADAIEVVGTKRAGQALKTLGMVYDQRARRWLVPVGQSP